MAGTAVITVALLTIQPWSGTLSPQSVLAKTSKALTEIQSYRMTFTSEDSEGDTKLITYAEVAYAAPDRFHLTIYVEDWTREYIRIGEYRYEKETGALAHTSSSVIFNTAYVPDKEATLHEIEQLTDIQSLPDEKIDGVECYRLRGRYNEPSIDEQMAERMKEKLTEEEYQVLMEQYNWDFSQVFVDLWIGKDDYLIRKVQSEIRNKDDEIIRTQTMTYYNFNVPLTIEPPLDADGELLEGWEISNSDSGGGDVPYPTATPPAEPPNK